MGVWGNMAIQRSGVQGTSGKDSKVLGLVPPPLPLRRLPGHALDRLCALFPSYSPDLHEPSGGPPKGLATGSLL